VAPRQIRADELSELIGCIYEIALAADGWDPLLERTTRLFAGTATVFFVQDRHQSGLQFSRLWGLPETALMEFESRFAPLDVGIDTLLAQPPGSVITDESTPREIYRSSEIFNDFRRRWSAERYLACDVFRDERRFGILAIQATGSRAPFSSTEAAAMLRLLPHLRRAVQIRTQLSQMNAHQSVLEELVDGLLVGVVLLNECAQVIYANAAARRIDQLHDGLRIARGQLLAGSPADDRALRHAIGAALGTSSSTHSKESGVLALRRPSGARPFTILVSPGPGLDSPSPLRIASAVMLIGDPDARLESGPDLTAQLYGLTPAQAHLANSLAAGESLETYAGTRKVALSTARWTMKQVLAKTGTRRQADLVRLLLTGPGGVVKL